MNLLAPFSHRAAKPAVVDATPAVQATDATPEAEACVGAANDRLGHLFRFSLKNGRIHPLYLPVLKYRHANKNPNGNANGNTNGNTNGKPT